MLPVCPCLSTGLATQLTAALHCWSIICSALPAHAHSSHNYDKVRTVLFTEIRINLSSMCELWVRGLAKRKYCPQSSPCKFGSQQSEPLPWSCCDELRLDSEWWYIEFQNNGENWRESSNAGEGVFWQNFSGWEISEWKICWRKQISGHHRSSLWR